jgi:acetyl-CoA carboxylase carboxyl transferase subunit alpha
VVIGQKKGTDTASRIARDFGPARPAGCRKAIRDPAHRSGLPVITPGDRPGAYSGKGAEGRGQGGSIARCTQKCLAFAVPVVTVVIAAGGSGGAVALVNAKRIAMLERPISAAISPEGWASILWKEVGKMRAAAAALRLTATDLQRLGMIDRVIAEPLGGAQRAPSETVAAAGKAGWAMRGALAGRKPAVLIACRRRKFPQMRAKGIAA